MFFVNVAINVPINRLFTYSVSERDEGLVQPGKRAVVPFRNKERIGYITQIDIAPPKGSKTKEILAFPDEETLFTEKMLKLLSWISDYYSAPIGEVFAAATPNTFNSVKELGKKRQNKGLKLNLSSFQKENLTVLNTDQAKILSDLLKLQGTKKFTAALLHGVTGSGKTEIYLDLIEKVLEDGKDSILLVPEISLTPQLAGRVVSRFKDKVAIYHSGLTDVQRLNQWLNMKNGLAKVLVGTRSAIFAPFNNLGLIIIDEEHDYSYKQEESPRYNAKDSGLMRGKLEDALVILGSATPSIESLANAQTGKYNYLLLTKRHGESNMPVIQVVDMKKEIKSGLLNPHLSLTLLSELKKNLQNKKQSLLFLNRRGYANFLICEDCGYIPECPNCKISLTFHKNDRSLRCHYCDLKTGSPESCPKCRGVEFIQAGSGTEMIEEVIRGQLPTARIERLDRDTATTEKKRRELLGRMHDGEIDILIGTQMITKGHDFPNVTLVGIISADQSIHFPDFRSGERTFQLITQVSGRAGRALHPGKVIIQTYTPEHMSIRAASEDKLEEYMAGELAVRKELSYPPYARIANIKISGNMAGRVVATAKDISTKLNSFSAGAIKVLGPAPAPLSFIGGKTRWQILLKSPSAKALAQTLASLRAEIDKNQNSGVQIAIDVDPVSTM